MGVVAVSTENLSYESVAKPVAGAKRRWRCPFRYRGSRRESAVAQLFSLGSMNDRKLFDEPKIFAQIGACLCALIGAVYCVLTAQLLFQRAFYSVRDAVIIIAYTLVAFVPFLVFVYPKPKTLHRSILVGVALLEILVLGLFLWNILFADD